ncbi:MAG: Glycogen synthase [Candidatus Anoxychlamydiales bacterium]|nr:Glycogen synthase [Candidatus Anoxychlamydiales bacterium]
MKIVHIAAEIAPIAKVGGLADVVYGLSKELKNQKQDVCVIIPFYKKLKKSFLKDLKLYKKKLIIFEKNRYHKNKIFLAKLDDISVFLIDPDKNYFKRNSIYGYKNDQERFLYFSKAALEFLKEEKNIIDILHIHDWHVSFIAPLYKECFCKKLTVKKIVLSIHNLEYQGLCKTTNIKALGYNGAYFLEKEKLQDPCKPKTINLLKGGIIYSDKIIPVSKTYASEILTKEYGFGLEKILKKHKRKIKGIINGIDNKLFSPKTSKHLKCSYDSKINLDKLIKIKEKHKQLLREKLNLNESNLPIIANIGRIVYQKGPDLIIDTARASKNDKYQFVLLGTPFNKKLEKEFHKLKKDEKKNKNLSINFAYDEKLCHLIFAASDFVLIPSKFEPCGLTQIIAFKFGSIPIVRKTGGLADSVFDIDNKNISKNKKNGFVFEKFNKQDMNKTINRALKFYTDKNNEFYKLLIKNMKQNYSWEKSAKDYLNVYKELINN